MPRIKAQRALDDGKFESADELYDLVLAATGSTEQADKAWRRFRWRELKSGQTPKE